MRKSKFLSSLLALAILLGSFASCSDSKDDDKVLSNENSILSFAVGEILATIDETEKTVEIVMPYGTDLTKLTPTIKVSPDATINPKTGVEVDLSTVKTYTVTAHDGTKKEYAVSATTTIGDKLQNAFWIIKYTHGEVVGNNDKINAVIKEAVDAADINGFPVGELLPYISFNFETNENFKITMNTNDLGGNKEPAVIEGKYSTTGNSIVFDKIEKIELGGLSALLSMLGITPELVEQLPELASALLPFEIPIVDLKEKESFDIKLDITNFFNTPEQIESIIEREGITGVDAKDVKIEKVIVTAKCVPAVITN